MPFRVNLILCEGAAFCGESSKKSSRLKDRGWRISSVVERLPTMYMSMGSVPSTRGQEIASLRM